MKTKLIYLFLMLLLILPSNSYADKGEDHDEGSKWYYFKNFFDGPRNQKRGGGYFPAIDNVDYKKECGACHMAFQPGLLPSGSWVKIMQGLDDHFGDNAVLEPVIKEEITRYLTANSAEKSQAKRAVKIMRSIGDQLPMKISDTAYILKKHNEISFDVYKRKAIGSIANCNACHIKAELGIYSERYIEIPK